MEQHHLEKAFQRRFELHNDNYKSLCPFHDEHTASFFVHRYELIAHCFGCGVGGSIDLLLSNFSGISRKQARQELDIKLEDSLLRADRKARKSRERQSEVTKFPESWLAPWKKEVHKYVIERGFTKGTIQSVGSLYDPNFKRQVFPHRDTDGRLLGCIGRACKGQEPKWFFYWDYNKGQALYRPFEYKPLRPTLVVEGVFDLLWLYQNGVEYNVAATLGSVASSVQIASLIRTSDELIIGYDNDAAGQHGTGSLYRALKRATSVSFIEWPDFAKDWCDLSKSQIEEVLSTKKNIVQRKVIRAANTSGRNAGKQTQGSPSA